MSKNKKSKRKLRDGDELVYEDDGAEDGSPEYSADGGESWSTDELYFDRSGRLIVKNRALANAITRSVVEQGGLVVHITGSEDGGGDGRAAYIVPKTPPVPQPPLPQLSCPDMLCKLDLHLVVSKRALRDPPRDRSWENLQGRIGL